MILMGETKEKYRITVGETCREYPAGTTFLEIAGDFWREGEDEYLLAKYRGNLVELTKEIRGDGQVTFLTATDKNGQKAYRRSMVLLMQKALSCLYPESRVDISVEHSLGQGYFCHIRGMEDFGEEALGELEATMHRLVEADLPLEKYSIKTREAMEIFRSKGMEDKARLLRYRASSNINLYDLDGCVDYFYGYMVPSTGYLKYFDLQLYQDGFMLLFPGRFAREVAPFDPSDKLYGVLQRSGQWSQRMGIRTVGALNDAIANGHTKDIILMQEALMERRIGELAERIAADPKKKFVMIAGPSSSGKTTFSHRLSTQLRALGVTPHPIPLDDYYFDRDKVPLDEFGQKDFECIEGLDVELFNHDMTALLRGERVQLPSFNFVIGRREYKDGHVMEIGDQDVLVIEGIHGLNERMSYSLPEESKHKIYISALTQLGIDEHNPLSTADGRLIRRIVRDARTRGTSAKDTIAMWDSVRRGEEKNIFPYQEQADDMFNSALVYEMSVLKLYAVPQLYAIEEGCEEYVEAKRLLKLLDYFLPVPSDDICNNSILREFIGGSCFHV